MREKIVAFIAGIICALLLEAGQNTQGICEGLTADLEKTKPDLVVLLTGGANTWNFTGYSSFACRNSAMFLLSINGNIFPCSFRITLKKDISFLMVTVMLSVMVLWRKIFIRNWLHWECHRSL